ncbi:heterokaryon incompatibility protein-domain-containing protein [Xylaria sp. FL0064]|nr:heterokaryon incompatibility protein-domain-containing protein [Xylaria sp. FL0064]
MGLSTFHDSAANTRQRQIDGMLTETPSGTFRYEPPEMDKDRRSQKARSRQYDIWSMGCIMVELLVWLLYGYKAIQKFRDATPEFWERTSGTTNYYVSSYVKAFLDIMTEDLGKGNVYWSLLDLLRTRALVVAISDEYKSSPSHREIAVGLHAKMVEIQQSFNNSYKVLPGLEYPEDRVISRKTFYFHPNREGGKLSAGAPRAEARLSTSSPDQPAPSTDPEGVKIVISSPTNQFDSHLKPETDKKQEEPTKIDDIWTSIPDNDFARGLFNSLSWDAVKPPVERRTPTLCSNCNQINSPRLFKANMDRNELESSSRECELCRLLYSSLPIQGNDFPAVISLRQNGSVVGISDGPDLLSIYTDIDGHNFQGAQLGLPKLPDHGSREQFLLLKEWIRVCDLTHETCRRFNTEKPGEKPVSAMPTRLVDLGNPLRLVQSGGIKSFPYVALSHCWGKTETLCTTTKNITEFMESIDLDSLPETFRNAIQVTRGIGIQYLWIDSLCIIQDDRDDWEYESAQMEQVFSLAYCTIGASSSKSSVQGFFPSRDPRPCVQLETPGTGRLYVCHNIDNFNRDVDLGELNSRGWVLQERALSRRTIFYTTTQVYWECGAGVHCETLSRLKNPRAAFLGDARFPNSALEYYRARRQMLIQDLYKRYSRLAFTYSWDRPLAILGLQKRLARAFGTRGAYGLFGTYFARLLLWRRSGDCLMTRIEQHFGARHRAPTWSWFSKVGAIDYLDLKFQQIDWAEDDFENPLNTPDSPSPTTADAGGVAVALRGQARKLIPPEGGLASCIILDEVKEDVNFNDLQCVVFGRDKGWRKSRDANYHTLIIRQVAGDIYERAGVASLKADHVAKEGYWVTIQ